LFPTAQKYSSMPIRVARAYTTAPRYGGDESCPGPSSPYAMPSTTCVCPLQPSPKYIPRFKRRAIASHPPSLACKAREDFGTSSHRDRGVFSGFPSCLVLFGQHVRDQRRDNEQGVYRSHFQGSQSSSLEAWTFKLGFRLMISSIDCLEPGHFPSSVWEGPGSGE
jgi:hypothetical protein